MMKKIQDSLQTQLISNWYKGLFFLVILVELFVENDYTLLKTGSLDNAIREFSLA